MCGRHWQWCILPAAGAEALDKKQRKHFDAWQLQSVKAAPQKPGRVSAAIGKGRLRYTLHNLRCAVAA